MTMLVRPVYKPADQVFVRNWTLVSTHVLLGEEYFNLKFGTHQIEDFEIQWIFRRPFTHKPKLFLSAIRRI